MLRLLSAIVVIGAVALGFVLLSGSSFSGAPTLAARSNDDAGVRVVVTPKVLGPGLSVWEFEVVMDTHTKPLNENLTQVSVLVDVSGGRHTPVDWQGDPPGGHHRKGVLKFTALAEMPKAVELHIDRIGGAGTRTFRWELE